ncbi:flagellar assembly protein T N-terminal domain-containing protein, partial [Alphaproteobacteria bacterium]|nr:flagellar assembly protein T N-terminal domain-containing protein [Alphaproteobacteria bacterium]
MFINFKKLFLNIENITICILFSIISFNALAAQNDSNFRNVEATGRAILIEGKIDVSRKRALEDALYIAALKGGANINGFSAIGSNTIINDQAIVSAANRVIDFKIIKETQEKEFLSIKIAAIVGGDLSSKNCKVRPINISLFKGTFNVGSDVPSILSRKMSLW